MATSLTAAAKQSFVFKMLTDKKKWKRSVTAQVYENGNEIGSKSKPQGGPMRSPAGGMGMGMGGPGMGGPGMGGQGMGGQMRKPLGGQMGPMGQAQMRDDQGMGQMQTGQMESGDY